ncbi:MAG: hypothetical protein K0S23_1715 [Fluviicola sp.]|jgi:hypothetical protein|uniref:hypothetical protein n=1 Tax=Fluviicola sp. TaxID=1917219 RepID=UPI002606DD81|nr:hypothetical protein [Fluviicola sp.]MDF3027408.1 hypothetical protein [Fluviicola sp.]
MNKLSVFLFLLSIACSGSLGFSQEGAFKPLDISFDLGKLKQLDFGVDSLDPDTILFHLFPAPMSEDDPELSEWKTSAYWTCSSCWRGELYSFEEDEDFEKELIPYERNYTSCTSILNYKTKDGIERAMASFSSSQTNDGTGRFTRGVLSLAHFEKQNGNWKLIDFNPFVNLQGSFTLASPVDAVVFNPNGKVYFTIHGGEANGVSPEDYWPLYQGLYVIDGESLSDVLYLKGASCRENGEAVGSVWDTEIMKIESNVFGTNIETKTTGLIVKEYNWFLPKALQFISKSDFDLLPLRFSFTANQAFYYTTTGWRFEKPVITIWYTDSKGIKHEQLVTTQNTCVK